MVVLQKKKGQLDYDLGVYERCRSKTCLSITCTVTIEEEGGTLRGGTGLGSARKVAILEECGSTF